MKSSVLLLFLLLVFSCKKGEKPEVTMPKIKYDSSKTLKSKVAELSDEEIIRLQKEREKDLSQVTREYTLSKKRDGFEYKVFCEEHKDGMINFTKVNVLKSGKLFQQLKINKDSTFVYHDYEVNFSCDEDWNFDGYNDFKLINWVGMADQSYYLWLYDKSSGKYKFSSSFSKIINPVSDKKNKEITSSYHAGPETYYYSIYKFKNGKYVQTYSEVDEEGK